MKPLNIGIIGGGLIGRTHTVGYHMMKAFFAEETRDVHLRMIAERDDAFAKETAERFGIPEWTGNWKELVSSDAIDLVFVCVPNDMHREIALETIARGKHIFCEKPLARTAAEAKEIVDAVERAGVTHGIGFNYRKAPAVLLIKRWIKAGQLGKLVGFRGSFVQDWGLDETGALSWRFNKKIAGSGSLGDLGSHVLDMARFLVGEISHVAGLLSTHITERPIGAGGLGHKAGSGAVQMGKVDVDDICDVLLQFENGAQGSLVASRLASGKKNHFDFEIYGMKGAVYFDWERPNEVLLSTYDTPNERSGFTRVLTGGFDHPYGESLWPIPGMGIGFGETFAVEMYEMLKAVEEGGSASPNFHDGLKINKLCDAIQKAANTKSWVAVE
jgi:predicted dehydrogenase